MKYSRQEALINDYKRVITTEAYQKDVEQIRATYNVADRVDPEGAKFDLGWWNPGGILDDEAFITSVYHLCRKHHVVVGLFEAVLYNVLGEQRKLHRMDRLNELYEDFKGLPGYTSPLPISIEDAVGYEEMELCVLKDLWIQEWAREHAKEQPEDHSVEGDGERFETVQAIDRALERYKREAYPIALCISPYATQQAIRGFLTRSWPLIREMQKKYADPSVSIGKVREGSSEVRERNAFLYDNREKSTDELLRRVAKDFKGATIEPGQLRGIISKEGKRRRGQLSSSGAEEDTEARKP